MSLVLSLVHQRVELSEHTSSDVETRRKANSEPTSVGSETLILQSHPREMHPNSGSAEVIRGHRGEHSPSPSGDLLRRPGWSFKSSLIAWTVPETGAYFSGNPEIIQRCSVRKRKDDMSGHRGLTISDAALTLSTAPIWSRIPRIATRQCSGGRFRR